MNENSRKKGKEENWIISLVLWVLLCGGLMATMLYTASKKTIVIANVSEEQTQFKEQETSAKKDSQNLLLQEDVDKSGSIQIPLQEDIKAENIILENRYIDREFWVYIQGIKEDFFSINAISGDISQIESGCYEVYNDGILLKIKMPKVFEYHSIMESGHLTVTFEHPKKLYEKIVVVDLAGGGEQENLENEVSEEEVILQIASKIQENLEEPSIKLYLTRLEDRNVSEEERIRLTDEVDADIFLRIGVSKNLDNLECYGIQSYYNEDYFIPEFGNVQLADIVTRKVTIASNNRAIGLVPAGEDSILKKLTIPAAEVCVGFWTNEIEKELLSQDSYQEKIAKGIAEAILEVYSIN